MYKGTCARVLGLLGHGGGRGREQGGHGGGRSGGRGHGGGVEQRARRSERVRKKKNWPGAMYECFVECSWSGTRQRFFLILKYALPSARSGALDKVVFAECPLDDTRQRLFLLFFAECRPGDTWQRLLCRVLFLDTRQIKFLFFYFPTKYFVVCFYTI
jgi:hypothetical protein